MITLIATQALRNHLNRFNHQETILEKRSRKFLTTSRMRTLAISLLALLFMLHPLLTSNGCSQDIQKHPCLTGPVITMQQWLQAPFEQPVQHTLISLIEMVSEEYQIVIWCDRSIPKDVLIQLDSQQETLGGMLDRALAGIEAVVVPLDGVLMIQADEFDDSIMGRKLSELALNSMNQLESSSSCGITVLDVCRALNTSALLANEQLLTAEQVGLLCRDSTIEGVRFFPNLFDSGDFSSVYLSSKSK
jgi:hypothetical protein